ncbi:MAG TPA: DUF434 domain-containing protein [Abditibacteriaceae bacterium]|jgi:hypothetical protein
MPDKRQHRGTHPEDKLLFAPVMLPRLCNAVADFSWLQGRNYAAKSALALVGDRYQLAQRQRLAVMRCACSDQARERRSKHRVLDSALRGQTLALDGYNILTTVEVALSGGLIFAGRDGCYRDLASMHGTFRRVEETLPAIEIIGQAMEARGVALGIWYLDSPVSNSGRLKEELLRLAAARSWRWQIEVVTNPDALLSQTHDIVVTADSVVLDACRQWHNLGRTIVDSLSPAPAIIDLSFDDTPEENS